jgi:two-component system chemotaxis response regulator CheB
VLSGSLDDGTAGLMSIVARGGAAVVQDPADALYPGMPENALREAPTAHVAPVAQLGAVLTALVVLQALAEQKDVQLERALWTSLRTLDEKISLSRRMERTVVERGNGVVARRYAASVAEAAQAADVLREFIRTDAFSKKETAL